MGGVRPATEVGDVDDVATAGDDEFEDGFAEECAGGFDGDRSEAGDFTGFAGFENAAKECGVVDADEREMSQVLTPLSGGRSGCGRRVAHGHQRVETVLITGEVLTRLAALFEEFVDATVPFDFEPGPIRGGAAGRDVPGAVASDPGATATLAVDSRGFRVEVLSFGFTACGFVFQVFQRFAPGAFDEVGLRVGVDRGGVADRVSLIG